MAIQLLSICTLCGLTIIGPIRLYYTGRYDQDQDDYMIVLLSKSFSLRKRDVGCGGALDPSAPEDYEGYLWIYVAFTYIFTGLTAYFMLRQTSKVVRTRQSYLGGQNSITDRTVRLAGIPHDLRTEEALKDHIDTLGIGVVRTISLCQDWDELDVLFEQRDELINKLERAWCEYLGPTWEENIEGILVPSNNNNNNHSNGNSRSSLPTLLQNHSELVDERSNLLRRNQTRSASIQLGSAPHTYVRPYERTGFLGLFGHKVDIIDKYSEELEELDEKIIEIRRRDNFKPTGTAFVTMDSVASAQMTAQATLDPRPHKLISATAPAPHDVIWRNLYMTTRERTIRTYLVTGVIAVCSVAMIVPVSYLASFLDYKTIKKFWPGLAKLLEESGLALVTVTSVLPTFILTFFNFIMPYFFLYLSSLQGFISHGEEELSVVSKNFLYIFFNMFVVFTIARAATSYWSYLRDTTQIACELADSLKKSSLFYVDLIILQGIGMFPFRLLQLSSIVRFPVFAAKAKSPRDYRELYKPMIFNHGIHLPQPILILIIVLLYSVISSKILAFGTIYFIFGYFTYKYQLMYSMVHIQHSTGQAWPLIFRRMCVGLILFHLAMAGILVLQKGYYLSTMLTPLPFMTLGYWYNFEDSYSPLLHFIALRAIETSGSDRSSVNDVAVMEDGGVAVEEGLQRALRRMRSQSKTIDEQREQHQKYVNPNLVRPLDGPWIGVEGNEIILANSEGTRRRKMRFEEWE